MKENLERICGECTVPAAAEIIIPDTQSLGEFIPGWVED